MCVNKLAFNSKSEANKWLKRHGDKGKKNLIYQCKCTKFHFTSCSKSEARRWRKRLRKAK